MKARAGWLRDEYTARAKLIAPKLPPGPALTVPDIFVGREINKLQRVVLDKMNLGTLLYVSCYLTFLKNLRIFLQYFVALRKKNHFFQTN